MPTGPGSTIDGVWKFGEDDLNALASDLLNRLGDSVRTKTNNQQASIASLQASVSLVQAASGVSHYSVANATEMDALTGMSTNDMCETRDNSRVFRYHSITGWRLYHSEWTSHSLASGWTANIPVFFRVIGGVLYGRGRVTSGASGSTFATLQTAFRPESLRRSVVVTGASAGTTPVTINSDGTMVANSATDFTLDSLSVTLWNG